VDEHSEPEEDGTYEDRTLPKERIDEVFALLSVTKEEDREKLRLFFDDVYSAYAAEQTMQEWLGTAKDQKAAIRRLLISKPNLERARLEIAPEYLTTIEAMADRFCAITLEGEVPSGRTRARSLRNAASLFLEEYEPQKGRPTDLPLEYAVRTLIPMITEQTGQPPLISHNKNKPGGPTLRSPEAQAIGILMTAMDPDLTVTALVNMIDKIRRKPEETAPPIQAIWLGDPAFELDCSLLPGREQAIEEIYRDAL
jgi:hypothetical protein